MAAVPPVLDYASKPPPGGKFGAFLLAALRAVVSTRGRRWIAATLCVAGVVVAGGYVSNSISRALCEQRTAKWLATGVMGGQPFHLVTGEEAESGAIFAAAGIKPLASVPGRGAFPWAEVHRGRSAGPFIVEVEYGWVAAPLAGEGGVRRYLCLFGYAIELGDRVRWVS